MSDLSKVPYVPIFCTTDLATASQFYISPRFVTGSSAVVPPWQPEGATGEPPMVAGAANDLRLTDAIVASAAFPGLLPPQFLASDFLGLPVREGTVLTTMCLADGG